MSFTTDSVAMASIRPSWCSVASTWRVPNSTANSAIESATSSEMSPKKVGAVSGPTRAMTEPDTALS